MKKIIFITSDDAEYGFKLTGLDHYVTEGHMLEDVLRKIISEPGTGLVVIDERLIKGINEETLKRMERTWHGIFIVLPSPEKVKVEIEDYAARLIRRAIGYHVRLRL